MTLLILRDLQYRKWRVGLTVLLMAIVMTLLFIMSGLVNQFNAEPRLATAQTAGDLNWVVSEGTGGPFTSPRPIDASRFEGIVGEPLFVAPTSMGGMRTMLVGHTFQGAAVPELATGAYPSKPGEVLIDESSDFAVGDPVHFGQTRGTVVGTTKDATVLAGVPLVYVTLPFSQQIAAEGRDVILGKITNTSTELPPGLKAMTTDEVAAVTLLPLDGAISSVSLIKVLLWMITVIVIAAVIYITALERTRDFAVLKAVGAKTGNIAGSLLVQGLAMTLIAVTVAGVLQSLLAPSFPLAIRVPSAAWLTISVGAAIAAIAAGTAGVLRVKSTSPIEAFG